MRILVAEDDPDWRNALVNLFGSYRQLDPEVTEAADMNAAAGLLYGGRWDLLVLDIKLGEDDSRPLIRIAGEERRCRALVVLTELAQTHTYEVITPDGQWRRLTLEDYLGEYFPKKRHRLLRKNPNRPAEENLEILKVNLSEDDLLALCDSRDEDAATSLMVRNDRYEQLNLVSSSHFAWLHKARDRKERTLVALKIMKRVADVDIDEARIQREAEVMRRVEHPNVVRFLDAGRDGSCSFLVYRWIEGQTLADRISAGPLPLASFGRTALGLLAGLDALHAHNIVHRDIKPSNVMLEGEEPLLTDFGFAKRMREEFAATWTEGNFVGSPHYCSPEQARFEDVDARSDIYSFGWVLFEMATGVHPFRSVTNMGELLRLQRETTPPRPSTMGIDVAAPVERIILRCLEKRPEDRYQAAAEVARDVEAFIASTSN